jgi:large conductance mechanosensitive channel
MQIIKEFQEFAMRGNVLDLAVGVIMGAAFGPIVTTLVDNVVMPPIGLAMAGIDFSTLAITLESDPDPDKAVAIRYGLFLNAVIKFLITAFAVFVLVKAANAVRRPVPAAPAPPPASEVYLREIRDALVKK